jgi:hypothetical protein
MKGEEAVTGWQAQARGVLIALHLGALTLLGLPEPAVEGNNMDDPDVIAWFDRTHASMRSWGIPIAYETFKDWGMVWGARWLAVRDATLWPIETYARYTGAHQHWAMFGSVPTESAIFFMEGQTATGWEQIHQCRYGERTWRKEFFDQERVRSLLNLFIKKKSRDTYDQFGRWLLPQLKEDFPEYRGFRTGILSVKMPPPDVLAQTGMLESGKRFWVTVLKPAETPTPVAAPPDASSPASEAP